MGWPQCVLLASAPGLFWLWMFYRRDRWEPEPLTKVLQLFLAGAVVAGPVWLVEKMLPGSGLWIDAFLCVALVEEVGKLLPVWWLAYYHKEFNEPMDGIVYAVAAALGFATVENALYAFYLGPQLLVARAFTSTLAHVAFSGMVGYHMGRAKFKDGGRKRLVLRALLAVVVLHGTYDLVLAWSAGPTGSEAVGRQTILVMVPAMLLLLFWAMQRACAASPFRPEAE